MRPTRVSSTPRLQVLIADSGDDFAHGRRNAELIRGLAEHDPHVIGRVASPGASGASRRRSGCRTRRRSRWWAPPGPPTAAVGRDRPGRLARDEYSDNLADDLVTALGTEKVTLHDPVYYSVEGGGISKAALDACQERPDVLLLRGAGPEFLDFLRALEGKSCGPGTVKVIAGDDVTKVVADHAGEIRDLRRVEVYYSALATREMRRDSPTPPTAFVYGLLGGKYPNASEDNLILTYDAAGVFYQAANTAYRSGGLLSKGDILYELARTSAGSAWNGSSGVVDFAGTERHDPVDKSIAIMRRDRTHRPHGPLRAA